MPRIFKNIKSIMHIVKNKNKTKANLHFKIPKTAQ